MASTFFLDRTRTATNEAAIPDNVFIPLNTNRTEPRRGSLAALGNFFGIPQNKSLNLNDYLDNYFQTNLSYPDNYLFVSKENVSTTPQKGNPFKAYGNPWSAAQAAVDGDIIVVLDGIYTTDTDGSADYTVTTTANSQSLVPATWTSGTYTFYFMPGTGVYDDGNPTQGAISALFQMTNPITVNVLGHGEFRKLNQNTPTAALGGGNGVFINMEDAGAELNFNAKTVDLRTMFFRATAGNKFTANVDKLSYVHYNCIYFRRPVGLDANIKINTLESLKDAGGATDYAWSPFRVSSPQDSFINFEVNNATLYGLAEGVFYLDCAAQNFSNNLIKASINNLVHTNNAVAAAVTDFSAVNSAGADDVGNNVANGSSIVRILRTSSEFSDNQIELTVNSADAVRLRFAEIDLASVPVNNTITLNGNSIKLTDANGVDINTLAGASNAVTINGNLNTNAPIISQGDAAAAGKCLVRGTWVTTTDSVIANAIGTGLILSNFIGRGGSTVSPLTTSGAGDIMVVSAAFNNVTAITGTTSGATPLQDVGF